MTTMCPGMSREKLEWVTWTHGMSWKTEAVNFYDLQKGQMWPFMIISKQSLVCLVVGTSCGRLVNVKLKSHHVWYEQKTEQFDMVLPV